MRLSQIIMQLESCEPAPWKDSKFLLSYSPYLHPRKITPTPPNFFFEYLYQSAPMQNHVLHCYFDLFDIFIPIKRSAPETKKKNKGNKLSEFLNDKHAAGESNKHSSKN